MVRSFRPNARGNTAGRAGLRPIPPREGPGSVMFRGRRRLGAAAAPTGRGVGEPCRRASAETRPRNALASPEEVTTFPASRFSSVAAPTGPGERL